MRAQMAKYKAEMEAQKASEQEAIAKLQRADGGRGRELSEVVHQGRVSFAEHEGLVRLQAVAVSRSIVQASTEISRGLHQPVRKHEF